MPGTKAATSRKGALTLTAKTASKSSAANSSIGAQIDRPALFTRMSTPPTSSPSPRMAEGTLMSAPMKRAVPPDARI